MTHVVTESCIGSKDQSCVEVCPVDCIYDASDMVVIHPGECIDCGACVPECPVQAIRAEADLSPDEQQYTAINAAIVDGPGAVDALLVHTTRGG
jgi:ferredoxin